jgi:hypothetical protein
MSVPDLGEIERALRRDLHLVFFTPVITGATSIFYFGEYNTNLVFIWVHVTLISPILFLWGENNNKDDVDFAGFSDDDYNFLLTNTLAVFWLMELTIINFGIIANPVGNNLVYLISLLANVLLTTTVWLDLIHWGIDRWVGGDNS